MASESTVDLPSFAFSRAERERRYGRVRALMAERGYDALLVPCNTGHNEVHMADVRYLVPAGGFGCEASVFFPREGEPTCWARSDSQPAEWFRANQDWVADVRPSDCTWSENFATSIRERDLAGGSFGVVGVGPTLRCPDGTVLYRTLARLREWFPTARFDDATEAMVDLRRVKSGEELAALERATEIAERAMLAARDVAGPDVGEQRVYAELVAEMVRQGAELPTLVLWGAGPAPLTMTRVPAARRLARGDVIYSEVEARYAGYIAQVRRPLFVGRPSAEWAALHALAVEAFERMCAPMRAGALLGDAVEALTSFAAAHGHRSVRAPMHARGLGEDRPHVSMQRLRPELLAQRLEAGQVFVVGPNLETPDGRRRLAWGDSVVVTTDGVRRLGKLSAEPLVAAG